MEIDPNAAKRLFQAVVTQALVDATSTPTVPAHGLTVQRRKDESDAAYADRSAQVLEARRARTERKANAERDDARNWLLSDMESFPEIVSLAGYNPKDIRERAKKLAAKGWPRLAGVNELAKAA